MRPVLPAAVALAAVATGLAVLAGPAASTAALTSARTSDATSVERGRPDWRAPALTRKTFAPPPNETRPGSGARASLTRRTFANPPMSVRPGTRWWWDSLVNETEFSLQDALAEVDAFRDAGFGRFEIAWAPGDYGTPTQQANLKAVAERAAQYGIQVDMTLGPGWPWATPATTGALGQQELMYGRDEVQGPATYDQEVEPAIGDDEPRGTLLAVTAAKVLTPGPEVTQANQPPAQSTVLDPGSLVDLTSKVQAGRLTWQVPAGSWIVFSFWLRDRSGNYVSLINDASVRKALEYVDANQLGAGEEAVRKSGYSFFEDSLELHADELYWYAGLGEQFRQRRGYNPTKYLPLMFVQKVSDYAVPKSEPVPDFELPRLEGARYRFDYYKTITDLYLDNHVKVVAEWATKYGMHFRTQPAYGNNFDTIRSAREAVAAGALVDDESLNAGDTPFLGDTQHYDDPSHRVWKFAMDHYRQVVSGSHQAGGLEVTSELGAWFGRELATSLREYKRMLDKEWAAGVTRPLLHGYTHSPADAPWPGVAHFEGLVGESLNFRTWPDWQHFRPLSDYWARGALVLQQGKARTDVAILRDSFVTSAACPPDTGGAVTLCGGGGNPDPFFDSTAMEHAGYTLGYVDSQGVVEAKTSRRGELFRHGPSYDALVVDGSQFYVGRGRLPGKTAKAIARASAKGLKVVFVGKPPRHGLSGKNPSREDKVVRKSVRKILKSRHTTQVIRQAQVADALRRLRLRPAARWAGARPVYTQLRQTRRASYYYLWNSTSKAQNLTASFAGRGTPTWLDLWSGGFEPVAEYRQKKSRVKVPVTLEPHGTAVLMIKRSPGRPHVVSTTADHVVPAGRRSVEVRDPQGGPQTVRLANGKQRTVTLPKVSDAPLVLGEAAPGEPWQLQATTYGPEGKIDRPAIPLPVLTDWRTIPSLNTESGIGTYEVDIDLPSSWHGIHRGAMLDLGTFGGGIQVFVNERRVTPNVDPQAPLDVTRFLRTGRNTVTVMLSTTLFNKAVANSPLVVITRPAWAASLIYPTQAYGLLSEVRLVPYARGRVRVR